MASIIIFSISLLILAILLFAKWQEEKAQSKNFISKNLSKLDPLSLRIVAFFSFKVRQVTQTVKYIIFIVIPQRTEESFKEARKAAIGQYKKQKEILMGKKDLSNGAASFYLKKIREDQENGKEGRIEEENI